VPGARRGAVSAQLERRRTRYERLHALAPGTGALLLLPPPPLLLLLLLLLVLLLLLTATTMTMSAMHHSSQPLPTPPQAEVFAARDDAKAAKRVRVLLPDCHVIVTRAQVLRGMAPSSLHSFVRARLRAAKR
jgi:hypothetical protein